MTQSHKYFCRAMLDSCEQYVNPKRAELGYMTCMKCGEQLAKERKHTIVPLNKSNYVVVSDLSLLTQLNPKRTT
jgi:ribosomal protein L37AE/L43A